MNETTNKQNKKQTKKKAGIKKKKKNNKQYGLSYLLKLELPLIIQFRKHKQNLPLRSMTVLWFNQLIITPVNCRLSGPFALAVRSDSYLDCHGGKDGTKQHIENIADPTVE